MNAPRKQSQRPTDLMTDRLAKLTEQIGQLSETRYFEHAEWLIGMMHREAFRRPGIPVLGAITA